MRLRCLWLHASWARAGDSGCFFIISAVNYENHQSMKKKKKKKQIKSQKDDNSLFLTTS